MSRNFELLRQIQKDQGLLQQAVVPAATHSRNYEVLRQAHQGEALFEEPAATPPAGSDPKNRTISLADFSRDDTFKLVQGLYLATGALAPRVLVFCAVASYPGSESICARAAELLARQKWGSVCIVDADLDRPSLHAYFKTPNAGGMAGALLGDGPVKDFVQPTRQAGLTIMPSGLLPPGLDWRGVLAPGRLQARMIELRARFDHVLVNAPPVDRGTAAACLSSLADGGILIVEPGLTTRRTAREAKEELEAAGSRVLGVVLHRRMLPFSD